MADPGADKSIDIKSSPYREGRRQRNLDDIIKEFYLGASNLVGRVSKTAQYTLDLAASLTVNIGVGYYSGWIVDQVRNTAAGYYLGLDSAMQAVHEIGAGRIDISSYAVLGAGLGILTHAAFAISKRIAEPKRTAELGFAVRAGDG